MNDDQLRLDLDDRRQYLTQLVENPKYLDSNTTWRIFAEYVEPDYIQLWLGTRTHDLGGTVYSYIESVTIDEARWLLQTEFKSSPFSTGPIKVYEFLDVIERYYSVNRAEAFFGVTPKELELARKCALEAVEDYGSDDGVTHQRILNEGIWNDHVAVQAAINAIKAIKK